jgi:hypothetical protein
MKLKWIFPATLWAALAIGTLAAASPGGKGTVGGEVLDTKGKPAAGVHVTLQATDGGDLQTATTNDQGRFWFPFLPEGQYSARASDRSRVSEWVKNLWVSPGRETDVTLHLHVKKSNLTNESPEINTPR